MDLSSITPSQYFYCGISSLEAILSTFESSVIHSDASDGITPCRPDLVIALLSQSSVICRAVPEYLLLDHSSRLASRRGASFSVVSLSEKYRSIDFAITSKHKGRNSGKATPAQCWEQVWNETDTILNEALKSKKWIAFSGLDLVNEQFIESLSLWGETNLESYCTVPGQKRTDFILWLVLPEFERPRQYPALLSFSPAFAMQTHKVTIRAPASFQAALICTLFLATERFSPDLINNAARYYEKDAAFESKTQRCITRLVFVLICFLALCMEHLKIQKLVSRKNGTKISPYTLYTLIDLVTGVADVLLSKANELVETKLSMVENWIWSTLQDNILIRTAPSLLSSLDKTVLIKILRLLLNPRLFSSDSQATLLAAIPSQSKESYPVDLSQYLQSLARPMYGHSPITAGRPGSTDISHINLIQACLCEVIGTTESFVPLYHSSTSHQFDLECDTWLHQDNISNQSFFLRLRSLMVVHAPVLKSSRRIALATSPQVVFQSAMVIRFCAEIREVLPRTPFNIQSIMQAVQSICLTQKDIPQSVVGFIRDVNLYNIYLDRMHCFFNSLPTFLISTTTTQAQAQDTAIVATSPKAPFLLFLGWLLLCLAKRRQRRL